MALILNLETSTTVCSVSLSKDGRLLAVKEQNGDYSHAENLTLFIEDVLQQADVKLSNVDAIAVSKGPGSYTGLRIGVSTAKGLCYSLNKPLIAISTLQHISLSISEDSQSPISNLKSLFCPMLDARRMEVYCAMFDSLNNEIRSITAEIIDEQSFSDLLNNNVIYFFGDGAAKCKDVLSANKNAIFIDDIFPSSKNMISLSEQAFVNKEFEDVAYFEPFYLKDFVAGKKKVNP
ncbi:MAG: tRNA (adenosine(37)-N6)-threonylcarbamoyltransferase complex dimerization subunit type 1 TsaB [Bacteroidota bacterium]|nr:tRNA (adenosine(37)-N6)-threonylcarbamoyltransferase complex dimerization subunit type 1 TsaB [Bacteroidota bacterium]